MQLKGRNVVVTGGTGGFGAALTTCLQEHGALVTTIGKDAGETIHCDLSDAEEVSQLCLGIAAMPIDVLIHNAGLQYFGRTHTQPEAQLDAMVAVNLRTPLQLTRAALPGMMARGRGQVVNIGSALAAVPLSHFSAYCATKSAMHAYSHSLRREYANRGITITYAAPRAMRTAMSSGPVWEFLARTRSATDDPTFTAEKIVQGIIADRKEIRIGFAEAFFGRLSALSPTLLDRGLRQHFTIAEDILPASQP